MGRVVDNRDRELRHNPVYINPGITNFGPPKSYASALTRQGNTTAVTGSNQFIQDQVMQEMMNQKKLMNNSMQSLTRTRSDNMMQRNMKYDTTMAQGRGFPRY